MRALSRPRPAPPRGPRRLERLAHRHETLIIVTLGNVARGGFAHVRGVPLPRLVGVRSVGGHLLGELPCGSGPAPGWNLGVPDGVEPVTDVLTGDEGGVPVALVGHSVVLISHPRRVCVPVWFSGLTCKVLCQQLSCQSRDSKNHVNLLEMAKYEIRGNNDLDR